MRDALLYFDDVVSMTGPIELGFAIGFERRNSPEKYNSKELSEISKGLLLDVLPEHLKNETFKSKLAEFYSFSTHYICEKLKECAAGQPTNFEPNAFDQYQGFIEDYGLRELPFWHTPTIR